MSGDEPALVELRVAALAELGLMTTSLMHELRQPLYAIKAIAELMVVQGPTERQESRLRKLLDSVSYMESLSEFYGGLARTDQPDARLAVDEVVLTATRMVSHQVRSERIDFVTDVRPNVAWVRARSGALKQIVLNLIQNAVDAVEGCATRRIELRVSHDDRWVTIGVCD